MLPINDRADDEDPYIPDQRHTMTDNSSDRRVSILEEERADLLLELAITQKALEDVTEQYLKTKKNVEKAYRRGFWAGVLNPADDPSSHWPSVEEYFEKRNKYE
jgi:hypothetical protein